MLTIDSELQALIPPLQAEERDALEASILAEGCRDAIVVWHHDGTDIIVDGHNRHAICTAHGLPYNVVTRDFSSRSDVKLWMIRNQLARRNLTPFKRTELALWIEDILSEQARHNSLANLRNNPLDVQNSAHREQGRTRDAVARIAEVSHDTVHKVKHVLTDAPAPIVDKARAGDISIHAAERMTKALRGQPEDVVELALRLADDSADKVAILARLYKSNGKDGSNSTFDEIATNGGFHYGDEMDEWCDFAESTVGQIRAATESLKKHHQVLAMQEKQLRKEARRDERIAAQTGVPDELSGPPYELLNVDIRYLDTLIPDESVDVIITDPPYPKEFVPLYDTLGKLAARVLKPGGSMIVMSGQSYLPEVIGYLSSHLNYHWTMAYMTPGAGPTIWKRSVNTFWKPLLWYVKGEYDGYWQSDVFKSDANEKSHHEWQQSISGMDRIIERFSLPDQVVLDPFCGAGTTGVSAISQYRRFIGVDLDPKAIASSEERLSQWLENNR